MTTDARGAPSDEGDQTLNPDAREVEIGRILNEFLDRRAGGESVSERDLFSRYPQYADTLRAHLQLLNSWTDEALPAGQRQRFRGTSHRDTQSERGADEAAPPSVSGYQVVREIGRGGMGIVYEGWDPHLSRRVAIKTISNPALGHLRHALFAREAQLAAKLQHPHIVTVYAFFDRAEPPCLVMDFVDGAPITEAARSKDAKQKAELMEKVVRAVDHAHSRGLIHRDLKPSNILVDREGEPRVVDFGLARIKGSIDGSTLGGAIKGTPAYMAPEQVQSPDQVGPPADIFALGLILYELLTGVPPRQLKASRASTDLLTLTSFELVLPRDIDPSVPEPLQRICLKACEQRPEDRYPSARHMADDLRRFCDDLPIRTRPKRYARLLEDRVRSHVDELKHWEQDRLISRRELDSLEGRYQALLLTDSTWVPDARRLRVGPTLVQFGGWLIVLSAIGWPVYYWHKLSSVNRIVAIGIPALVVNIAAPILWWRFSRLLALLFTVVGTLLLAGFLLVLLSELNLVEYRMDKEYEPLPPEYFCNLQLLVATAAAAVYAGAWLVRRRFSLLAADLCFLLALTAFATLLILGLGPWLRQERLVTAALNWLPYVLATYAGARWLDRPGLSHLASPFYVAAGLSFVLVTSGIAYDAPRHWFKLSEPGPDGGTNWLNVTRYALFFACGILFLGIALVHDRAATRLRRLVGRSFFKLVPPFCLISLHLLGYEKNFWVVGQFAGEPVGAIELSVAFMCICFIGLGVVLQLRWFVYYGLIHQAYALYGLTNKFFNDVLSWPVCVALAGLAAMMGGLACEAILSRARRDPTAVLDQA